MNVSLNRTICHRYEDPLARLWIVCAERIGFRIVRTREAYASTDGQGTLLIAEDSQLDADDSLAQMILHELCHALIEGEKGQGQVDWGLGIYGGSYPWREWACLRLQAALARRFGLRDFLAPTTDFRESFWNHLPDDPFMATAEAGGRREKSCVAARIGFHRAMQPAWRDPMDTAFRATAQLAGLVQGMRQGGDEALPSLWNTVQPEPCTHVTGLAPVLEASSRSGDCRHCADCAWFFVRRGHGRCRHLPSVRLAREEVACLLFEPMMELDCQTCGACCREAYDSVEVSRRDPVVRSHPELILERDTHLKLRRTGSRCAALEGGNTPAEPFACSIYPDRPATCREFERAGLNCLQARQRVGLSL